MAFFKVSSTQKKQMLRNSGYRERDIVSNSKFAVLGNRGRTVKFFKAHDTGGDRYDTTKYDTCTYDLKSKKWVG